MPRRKRAGKRRAEEFAHLDGHDMVTLLAGWEPPASEHERSRTQLQTLEDCRAAWEIHRQDGFLQSDQYGRCAWAWWEFDAQPKDRGLSEYAQLARWGLLTEENIKRIRGRFDQEMIRYESSHDKEEFGAVEEGEALAVLGLLSEEEQQLVRDAKRDVEQLDRKWELETR